MPIVVFHHLIPADFFAFYGIENRNYKVRKKSSRIFITFKLSWNYIYGMSFEYVRRNAKDSIWCSLNSIRVVGSVSGYGKYLERLVRPPVGAQRWRKRTAAFEIPDP
jgi:hypothetical protein